MRRDSDIGYVYLELTTSSRNVSFLYNVQVKVNPHNSVTYKIGSMVDNQ